MYGPMVHTAWFRHYLLYIENIFCKMNDKEISISKENVLELMIKRVLRLLVCLVPRALNKLTDLKVQRAIVSFHRRQNMLFTY